MSSSSGIVPAEDLIAAWQNAQTDEKLRVLTVTIEKEQLVVGQTLAKSGDAAEDYDQLQSLVQSNVPAFLLFKLDDGTWLLVVYVPDIAQVRQKMLYASTRVNLTRSLGDNLFSDSLHAHTPADLTSKAYRAHLAHSSSASPLTEREQELASLKEAEGIEARGTGPRGSAFSAHEGAKGAVAWDEEAETAVQDFVSTTEGAVHLTLDVPRETVVLASTSAAGQLSIPTAAPSYNLIAHKGSIALVYCCPSTSPIKSRLLSSASVLSIQKRVTAYGLVAKRLETSDPSEITTEWLEGELGIHTSRAATSTPARQTASAFARPKRPGGRAPARQTAPDSRVALPEQTTGGESESTLP